MKAWIRTSLAAAIAASLGVASAAALAAPFGDCDVQHGRMHGMKQHMDPRAVSDRATERLASLQGALALKPEQAIAWEQFKAVMLEKARKAAEHMQAMQAQERPKTALERMDRMESFGKDRIESMHEMRRATEALYGKLDAAQKATFDAQFQMGANEVMHHRRGGRSEEGAKARSAS